MGRIDQNEYAFANERDGFVLVASSIENPPDRGWWSQWLGGWQNINRANHVRQPSTSRVYLRDDQQGAVVLRQQTGSDSRRDMRVSVLVGSAEDLTGWGAARLAHWPVGRQLTDPDQSGVALIARPDLTAYIGANVVRLQEAVLADALELTSPVSGRGNIVLVNPLAALLAAVLKLRAEFVGGAPVFGGRRQLVPVGADEPAAAALVLVLTELLRQIGDGRDRLTYSTFEATYPRVGAHQRDPQVLFMPDFVQPERGLTRPVAYVFLAPGLREDHQPYVRDGAAGDGPFEYIARTVVWAYLQRELAHFPRLNDSLLRQPENWAGAVEDWAIRKGGPPRSQPVILPTEPTIPAASRQVAPLGEPPEQRWRHAEAQAGDGRPEDAWGEPRPGDGPRVPEAFSASAAAPTAVPVAGPTAAAAEQTRHAEDTLRRAIANLHNGLVGETTHTVDAFVRALRSRQWLTPVERNHVRKFLMRVMPGLAPRAAREPYEEMTDPGLRRVRPSAVDALARLASPDATAVPASVDVVDCLAGVLELESGNALLLAETRDALLLLVHVPTAPEHAGEDRRPKEPSSELAPRHADRARPWRPDLAVARALTEQAEDAPISHTDPGPPAVSEQERVHQAFADHLLGLVRWATAVVPGLSVRDGLLTTASLPATAAWLPAENVLPLRRVVRRLAGSENDGLPLESPRVDALAQAPDQTAAVRRLQDRIGTDLVSRTDHLLDRDSWLPADQLVYELTAALTEAPGAQNMLSDEFVGAVETLRAQLLHVVERAAQTEPREPAVQPDPRDADEPAAASVSASEASVGSPYEVFAGLINELANAKIGDELSPVSAWFAETLPKAWPDSAGHSLKVAGLLDQRIELTSGDEAESTGSDEADSSIGGRYGLLGGWREYRYALALLAACLITGLAALWR
ncbi:hypothetical protein [Parafrankia sp. BMG5.11]|uniref:hypothetical protein n=1 Tax=Parafrankia sp. BMG5.11 TaxID=222540 RepID=UPI00103F7A12|nr:hypothetical protein [Parafrankia sp. BMG5.11]TCJ36121.1 hypothetical protein E0504_24130 [Parafrankia sp. BMG5.11]